MWETWVWSLGWEDPLEKGKATHSSILAWRIPWTFTFTFWFFFESLLWRSLEIIECLVVVGLVTQLCPTLCNPKEYSPPGSPVCWILQARILEWVAMPCSRRSSRPRNWICVTQELNPCLLSCLLHWQVDFLPRVPSGKPKGRMTLYMTLIVVPHSSVGEESACNAGDPGLIPGLGRSAGEGIDYLLQYSWAYLVAQLIKNMPAMWETWVWSLGWEDPLEKGKATHFSLLAWRISWIA